MKLVTVTSALLFAFTFLTITNSVNAQTNEKLAREWVNRKEWANGISLNVAPSVDAQEFYKQYQSNKAVWDKVFQFLKSHNLDTLSAGKYPIDGDNAYASITYGPSKTLDEAKWESHRKYIDLQYVIKGEEKIEVAPVSSATVVTPYNEARDAANYTGDGMYYIAMPGTFYLFFPQDAHRPNIKVDGFDEVKKLVIKIKVVQ
ncbi:NanQ anomerase/TabA/YiaL family protein [Mucilaginibacter sp.]